MALWDDGRDDDRLVQLFEDYDDVPPRVNWWGVFTLLGFLAYFAAITWGAMLVVQAWRAGR